MIPGEYHVASEPIDYNGGYEAISLEVKNVGDRAAQVGSHSPSFMKQTKLVFNLIVKRREANV